MAEITIDLDKDGPYSSGIFKIEILQIPYDDCDIIDRKTHYPVGNCKLKSLKSKILGVKIENDKIFDNVSYVYVFFSTIEEKVPIVFGISTGNDNNVIYYTGFSEENQTYKLSSLKKICNENLLDDLVKESDKVNNTLTYLLDKKTSYNDIKVTRIQNQIKPEDWIFTHSPINKEKLRKSTLLLKYKKCKTKPDISLKVFPKLIVYWFKTNDNSESSIPLLFECTADGIDYCYSRDNKDENEWTNILLNDHDILETRGHEKIKYIKQGSPEKVENQMPHGFNALFLGLIFYILFTVGFCLPPLYKIYRHVIKRYVGKHSKN